MLCKSFGVLFFWQPLQWHHYGRDSISNHQPHHCLLNRLFRRISKKSSKLRATGLCVGNSPGPVNSPHKWPVMRKMFPFDDVIMEDFRKKPTGCDCHNAMYTVLHFRDILISLYNSYQLIVPNLNWQLQPIVCKFSFRWYVGFYGRFGKYGISLLLQNTYSNILHSMGYIEKKNVVIIIVVVIITNRNDQYHDHHFIHSTICNNVYTFQTNQRGHTLIPTKLSMNHEKKTYVSSEINGPFHWQFIHRN